MLRDTYGDAAAPPGHICWQAAAVAPEPLFSVDFHCLASLFERVQAACEEESSVLLAPIRRRYNEALEVYRSTSTHGLKRFEPLCLVPPSVRPASRVPAVEALTFYHSACRPIVRLCELGASMQRSLHLENEVLAAALVLFTRVQSKRTVTAHMMHRLYVACLIVAMKALRDSYDVSDFSAASQLLPLELARLEWQLADDLEWNLLVSRSHVEALLLGHGRRVEQRTCGASPDETTGLPSAEASSSMNEDGITGVGRQNSQDWAQTPPAMFPSSSPSP